MSEPVSLRGFAESLDPPVSHTAVRKAIEAGHIPPEAITYDHKGHPKIADPELAARTWKKSVLPYDRGRGKKLGPKPDEAQPPERFDSAEERAISRELLAEEREAPPEEPEAVERRAAASVPTTSDNVPPYARSRAIREAFAAQMAKLEYAERAGELVSANEVKVQWFNEARRIRDALLNVPARITDQLAGLVGEVSPEKRHAILLLLQQEITVVLDELSDGASER
jgi:phage terminase Nu1 subunit (DNA packaging protein)